MHLVRASFVVSLLLGNVPLGCWAQGQPAVFATSYAAEARADYAEAIAALQAGYTGTYEQNVRLGWLFLLAKDYPSSIAHYQRAVRQRPAALEARFGLLKPLSALGQVEEMFRVYAAILHLDPQNTQANYWTGVLYLNRQAFGAAARHFERVVSLYPFDYDANLALAQTYLHLHKPLVAKALFNQVLLIRPGDAAAIEGLRQLDAPLNPSRPALPLAYTTPATPKHFLLANSLFINFCTR
ncbi:hypothetical protein GCM10023172_01390 [Hymenobacter ginsengisoli]|uniref:Tetratricopeptide repeat protein n=1 Tax=Hymenobacter ginsengisoli TaxID=1051626 RepID=A0ABP8PXV2_9BACT|nr:MULTISPECIES: tetratricopeptide repeat protein [unclassified Hymenobacter]MBO2033534.1 tetratricopeptide repeat protein [Hymenobacter sp. BT559]